jgi:hypothetical protein
MGKTKDLGHLAHIVAYDAENHITVPAGITMHTNQLVASQSYVTTALASYALSSALSSYVPTSRTITINGTTLDLSANRTFTIAAGLSSFNTRTGDVTLTSSDVTTALGFTPVTNARTITINGTTFDLSADRSYTVSAGTTLNGTGFVKASGTTITYDNSTYLTGITSTLVTNALGFTPYNATNPDGYITSAGSISGNAATATSADNIDGVGFVNTNSNLATVPDTIASNGISYTSVSLLGQSDGALYSQSYSSSWQHQIFGDYRTGQIAIRGKNANSWQAWRTVIDSGNIGSQSVSNATTAGGLAVHTGRNNEANKIVRTDGNGYIQAGYINSTSGNENNNANADRVWGTNGTDDYLRTYRTSALSVGTAATAATAANASGVSFLTQPNATWAGRIQLGGNGDPGANAALSVVQATDGNLHMDCGTGKSMYLNYYRNGIIYLNGGTYNISANGSQYNGNSATVGGYSVSVAGSANTIPTRNASGYLIPENWIQLNGIYGLYSPTNGAHFYPNDRSYGSWKVLGDRNGWRGLHFGEGTGITLMMNEGEFGFHRESVGWVARFTSGHFHGYANSAGTISGQANSATINATSGNAGNNIVLRDGNGDIAIGTLNTNHAFFGGGGRGLTSADTYGSYGSVHTYGTGINGYAGYGAYDNAGYRSFFMWNSGNGGIYMQDRGKWELYYFGSNDCTAITGSETYDWVRACTNGKHRITNDSWCDAISYAVSFNPISDARLKENVVTVDNALDKILQLRGVYYNWIIDTENKKHIGVIAQEVQEVCPEAVLYHEETDTLTVSYNDLSGVLIEGVKELNQKLTDANARIELLETKINQLLNA